eukprot:jgi/Tetstr1/453776/TSEL_040728.t1
MLKVLRRGDDASEAARAPVVPATPVAFSGLDERLAAWVYVGAGVAACREGGAGGLGLGGAALGALPLDGDPAGEAPAARDAPGLPDVLDDVLGDGGDPGSTARPAAPSAEGVHHPPQPGHHGAVAWEGHTIAGAHPQIIAAPSEAASHHLYSPVGPHFTVMTPHARRPQWYGLHHQLHKTQDMEMEAALILAA